VTSQPHFGHPPVDRCDLSHLRCTEFASRWAGVTRLLPHRAAAEEAGARESSANISGRLRSRVGGAGYSGAAHGASHPSAPSATDGAGMATVQLRRRAAPARSAATRLAVGEPVGPLSLVRRRVTGPVASHPPRAGGTELIVSCPWVERKSRRLSAEPSRRGHVCCLHRRHGDPDVRCT
jgi:hypothetical protein